MSIHEGNETHDDVVAQAEQVVADGIEDSVTIRVDLELPDSVAAFIQMVQGSAGIVDWYDHKITIELVASDEFEAGKIFADLEHEITTLGL